MSKRIPVMGLDLTSNQRQNSFKKYKFFACDVRNKKRLQELFQQERITHVIHLAYLMDPQHDMRYEYDVDVNGSKSVFEAAHETKTVKQFIHFSSASAYGAFPDNSLWITEERPLRPRDWVYAQNKKIVEEYYNNFKKNFKLINLRMCTAVGPSYDKKGGVVNILAKSPIGLLLDGKDTAVQFIHEEDIKNIIDLIIKDKKIEGTFNLASDSYATTKELNSKKWFIPLPKWLFKSIISLLWHLRITTASPTSVNLVAHSIIVSPKKLMERYNYRFLYSTNSAYEHAVKEREKNGTL